MVTALDGYATVTCVAGGGVVGWATCAAPAVPVGAGAAGGGLVAGAAHAPTSASRPSKPSTRPVSPRAGWYSATSKWHLRRLQPLGCGLVGSATRFLGMQAGD